MPIIVDIPASETTYTKGRGGAAVLWIVVHYTGGSGTARDNGMYFSVGNRGASAHYFVDGSGEVVRSVREEDTAWAVGNFWANQRSVSIEVCSSGEDFTDAEVAELRWLVQDLRARYGIAPENVIRHYDMYDFAVQAGAIGGWVDPHKACPAPYISHERWHNLVWLKVAPDDMSQTSWEPDSPIDGDVSTDDFHGGVYRCTVDHLRVRDAPSLSGTEVAHYDSGQTVELDDWYTVADGYVWGRYIAYSGAMRYIAVGPHTGKPEADDFLVLV